MLTIPPILRCYMRYIPVLLWSPESLQGSTLGDLEVSFPLRCSYLLVWPVRNELPCCTAGGAGISKASAPYLCKDPIHVEIMSELQTMEMREIPCVSEAP